MYQVGMLIALLSVLQDSPYTLKLDVPVVSVDVTVLDSRDNLINNLTKDDFQIYENGILQEIRFFSPVSTPYNVFLLFDSSDSTRQNRDFMREAAMKLIENLRERDSIAIGSFDDEFRVNLRWTLDRSKANVALANLMRPRETNETRFYAALDQTLRKEFNKVVGRRAVVVLTDGQDTPFSYESNRDLRRALQATREQRIPVSIVVLQREATSQIFLESTLRYFDEVRFNMQRFVDNSGGEILFSKDLTDVGRLYEQIGQRLGNAYSLGYVPSNAKRDGAVRKIEVRTHRPNVRVIQSRETYKAEFENDN